MQNVMNMRDIVIFDDHGNRVKVGGCISASVTKPNCSAVGPIPISEMKNGYEFSAVINRMSRKMYKALLIKPGDRIRLIIWDKKQKRIRVSIRRRRAVRGAMMLMNRRYH